MTKEFHLYYSKKKLSIFVLLAFIVLAAALLLVTRQYVLLIGRGRDATALDYSISYWIGWALIGLFVIASVVFVSRMFKTSPVITISDKGILLNGYQNYHSVSWDQISGVGIQKDFIFKNVSVSLHNPEEYIAGAKKLGRFSMKSNLKRFGAPILINLMVLNATAEEVVTECNLYMMGRKS